MCTQIVDLSEYLTKRVTKTVPLFNNHLKEINNGSVIYSSYSFIKVANHIHLPKKYMVLLECSLSLADEMIILWLTWVNFLMNSSGLRLAFPDP